MTLFVGNERGGQTAANLSSFAAICKRPGVAPHKYLPQVLVNVPHLAIGELMRSLPDRWKVWNEERERAAAE